LIGTEVPLKRKSQARKVKGPGTLKREERAATTKMTRMGLEEVVGVALEEDSEVALEVAVLETLEEEATFSIYKFT
jgi:hypothetical protein